MEHLREAMPFDRVRVTMSMVKKPTPQELVLRFEYFRIPEREQESEMKLCTSIAWLGWTASAPLPRAILDVFNAMI